MRRLTCERNIVFLFMCLHVDANVSSSMSHMVACTMGTCCHTQSRYGQVSLDTHACLPQCSRSVDGGWSEWRRGAGTG